MGATTCNLLIIGNADECRSVVECLPRQLTGLRERGQETLRDVVTQELVLERTWEVDFATGSWDICIFFLSTREAQLFMANHLLLQERARSIIYIVDRRQRLPGGWRLRSEHDLRLMRPYSENQLASLVERIGIDLARRGAGDCTPDEHLDFLRLLTNDGAVQRVEPDYSSEHHRGFHYALVEQHYGRNIDADEVLEHLTDLTLLQRRVANRLRTCGNCDAVRLNYREQCPQCGSIDFARETIIHHFACGHMNTLEAFTSVDQELVCPKCSKQLRHIGLDYEKPSSNMRCRSCRFIFADPVIKAECHHCGHTADPAQTNEHVVYAYQATEQAAQVVADGVLQHVDLSKLLRSSNGLYSRELFVWELRRDIARFKRYRVPSSVVLVRLNQLDELQQQIGDDVSRYVNQLFVAIGADLRTLDITCVWERNLLAVLLPGTPLEGAWIVANRMEERATTVDLPIKLPQRLVSCSAETVNDQTQDADGVIAAALALHAHIADISRSDFMPQ